MGVGGNSIKANKQTMFQNNTCNITNIIPFKVYSPGILLHVERLRYPFGVFGSLHACTFVEITN